MHNVIRNMAKKVPEINASSTADIAFLLLAAQSVAFIFLQKTS